MIFLIRILFHGGSNYHKFGVSSSSFLSSFASSSLLLSFSVPEGATLPGKLMFFIAFFVLSATSNLA